MNALIVSERPEGIKDCAERHGFDCTTWTFDVAWRGSIAADSASTFLGTTADLVIIDECSWVGEECRDIVERHLVSGEIGPIILILVGDDDEHGDRIARMHSRVYTHHASNLLDPVLDELSHVCRRRTRTQAVSFRQMYLLPG